MSGKIDEMRGAGFSDEEIANYAAQQRKEMQSVGFAPNEIDGYFNGVTVPPDPPKPFLNRLIAGGASVFSLGSKAESAFSQSFSSGGQLGFSDDDEKNLREMGIFRNPETGHAGPLRFMNEAIMRPTAATVDALMRAPPALIAGLTAGAKEIGRQEGQSEQQGASMERELNLFGNFALQVGGADLPPELSISRPDVNHLGHVHDAPIGGVPKSETFNTAAKAIGGPKAPEAAEQKLLTLYTDHGFHPAEVAHDAANDVTVTQHLLSDGPDLPYGIDRLAQAKGPELDAALAEEGVDPRSVSGDIRDRTLAILAMDAKANPLDAYQHVVADMTRKSIESEPQPPDEAPYWYQGVRPPEQGGITANEPIRSPFWTSSEQNARSYAGKGGFVRRAAESDFHPEDQAIMAADRAMLGGTRVEYPAKHPVSRFENLGIKSEETSVPGEASVVEQSVAGGQAETLGRPPESGEPAGSIVPVGQERASVPQPATGGAGGGGEIPEDEHPVPSERAGGGGFGGGGDNGSGGTTGAPQPVGPNRPLSDAEEKVLSRVSVGEKDPIRAMTLDRLYTHVMDQLFPLSKATKEAEAELGRKIPTEDNPYQLARLISGVAGKAEHMLNHGMFDFESYENIGPSFKEIIAPVKDDLNGFRAFSTALRAAELEREGIKTGVDMDAARDVVMKGNARYGDTLLKLVDYQRNLARYLKESGVISQAGYDAMTEKWAFYVPFNRVMGDGIAGGPKGVGASLQTRNPIHAIEGSGRIIVDPIENIIRNTYLFSSMAEKNAVGVKLIDMLLHMGEISELKEINPVMLPRGEGTRGKELTQFLKGEGVHTAPPDLVDAMETEARGDRPGEISIFRDGKRETYMVDPDLARAFKGLDAASVGFWEKLLSIPANLLRAGATLTPEFAVRHFFRDYIYAAVTADKGVFTPVDSVKGFIGLIAKDADYQNWLKGGGSNITMVSLDRRYLQHDLAKLTGQTGLMTRAWNVIGNPQASITAKARAAAGLPFEAVDHFALSPLRMLTEYAEGASHLGAFKREMRRMEQEGAINKPEIQQAAFTSRDTAVDAARRGASMRAYNMMTAFASITLQDSDRIVRAIKDNPAKTLLALTLGISVPSALLWAVNHDDPRYKQLNDSDRDTHWIFLTDKWMDKGSAGGLPDRGPYDAGNGTSQRIVGGRVQINKGNIYRAPKPFSAGVLFGSGVERSMEAIINQNPHAFDHFTHSLIETSVPSFFPSAAVPFIEQWANRRLFTNRTLIPADMEKLLPEYQYTPYTTEAAKAIGRIVGAFPGIRSASVDAGSPVNGVARAISTPILMENYLRAWTGTLGMYALQAADKALRVQGILPDIPGPTDTLADNPFTRAFTIRYPSANAQSVQDFHDRYGINKRFYATWDARAKAGDRVAMDQIKQAGGDAQFAKLDQFEETLKRQGQVIRLVFKNPRISPDQQRQLIDSTYYGMIQTAHAGLQALDGIEAAIRARGH